MSAGEHRAEVTQTVRCAVITVSDTRTPDTDVGGKTVVEVLRAAGHEVVSAEIVRDEPVPVAARLAELRDDPRCQAVLLTGGTGIAARDATYEAVVPLLEKRLDGFGELFRMLSFAEIGPAAMLSRATAGTMGDKVVFLMPGSPAAVKLAMERLILPVLGHAVHLLYEGSRSSLSRG